MNILSPIGRRALLAGALLAAALPLHAQATDTAAAPAPLPFPNPGFETGSDSWFISKEDEAAGLSRVVPEAAHSGQAGLRVKQAEGGPGSWMQSAKIPVEAGKRYRISYWARCVEESGVGIWVNVSDADQKPIKPADQMAFVSLVPPDAREWTHYVFDVTIPQGGTSFTLAVHCFSKRASLADFDDFEVTPNP